MRKRVLKKTKKKFVVAYFTVKSQYYPGGCNENHEILIYLNLTLLSHVGHWTTILLSHVSHWTTILLSHVGHWTTIFVGNSGHVSSNLVSSVDLFSSPVLAIFCSPALTVLTPTLHKSTNQVHLQIHSSLPFVKSMSFFFFSFSRSHTNGYAPVTSVSLCYTKNPQFHCYCVIHQ
jgi:hypothetical protein